MKIFVYAIYDTYSKEIYVGMSKNVAQRLSEHRQGKSKYTKKFKDIMLFYSEEYSSYEEARKREKQLKNSFGKAFLKSKLSDASIV